MKFEKKEAAGLSWVGELLLGNTEPINLCHLSHPALRGSIRFLILMKRKNWVAL